jgi:transcriptional regulator with XRE-family HTH domain
MAIVIKTEEIERRRMEAGLSQDEAARRAGFSTQQQWSNLVSGARGKRPSAETLMRVARVLECRVEDIAELKGAKPSKRRR